jgi:hypothetical protein
MGIAPQGALREVTIEGETFLAQEYETTKRLGELAYVRPHHRSMARMFAMGLTSSEIAAVTGFTPTSISKISGSPLFQLEVRRLESKLEDDLVEHQRDLLALKNRAVEILDEDMHMEVGDSVQRRRVRQAAAFEVLSKTVPNKVDPSALSQGVTNVQVNVENMTVGQLQDEIYGLLGKVGN